MQTEGNGKATSGIASQLVRDAEAAAPPRHDYIKIEQRHRRGLTGWSNGDFNYDGKVSIDDYITIIDANIGNQSGIFPTAGGSEGVTAVPEPGRYHSSARRCSFLVERGVDQRVQVPLILRQKAPFRPCGGVL